MSFFPGANQNLRLGFSYADLEAHSPSWESDNGYSRYDKNEKGYSDKSRGHGDLEYNLNLLQDKIQWKALAYYLWDKNQWYYGDTFSGYRAEDSFSKYIDTTRGTDQQFTISLIPYNKIVAGYTFEFIEKESEAKTDCISSRPYTPGMEYKTNSVYIQDSVNLLNDNLNIIIGARYDRFDLKTKRPETGDYITFNEKSENYDHITPRGGIVYKPLDYFRIRANAGQAFKTPSADQLSAEYEHDGFFGTTRILGNPDLDPETSITYEGGIDLYPDNLSMGATYSYTKTKDKIVRSNDTVTHLGEEWTTYENLGKSELQAIDCYVEYAVGRMLKLPVGIDIASTFVFNLEYKDKDTDEDLLYISDSEVKSSIRFSYEKASATLFHVYVGKQNIQNWDTYPATIQEKGSFYFFNLTFNVEIFTFLKLEAGVYNLFNKEYEWVRGYPTPERNFKVAVTGKL